jgi:hypothetical protein
MAGRISRLFVFLLMIMLMMGASVSYAYIDPGTGGMVAGSISTIIAMAIGAVSSLLFFFRKTVVRLYARKGIFVAVLFSAAGLLAVGIYFLTH